MDLGDGARQRRCDRGHRGVCTDHELQGLAQVAVLRERKVRQRRERLAQIRVLRVLRHADDFVERPGPADPVFNLEGLANRIAPREVRPCERFGDDRHFR